MPSVDKLLEFAGTSKEFPQLETAFGVWD